VTLHDEGINLRLDAGSSPVSGFLKYRLFFAGFFPHRPSEFSTANLVHLLHPRHYAVEVLS
jgi:hypothetical protein